MAEMKRLYVKVEYGDKDITAKVEPYLTNLKYEDDLGDSRLGVTPSDSVTVTLADSRRLFQGELYPTVGSALCFEFGYSPDNAFKSGRGYLIDLIQVTGSGATDSGGDTVVWKALAQLPGKGIHTKKCKAWTNTSLAAIARAMAAENGMELAYECEDEIKFFRIDQVNESDLSKITRLARKYGLVCSIKAGKGKPTLAIVDLASKLTKPPAFRIYRKDCTGYSFEDWAARNPAGRHARYFDVQKKELLTSDKVIPKGTRKDGLSESDVDTPDGRGQQDRARAREAMGVFASSVVRSPDSMKRTAKLDLPGNPSLLAGVVVELPKDEWQAHSGVWVIVHSEHNLSVTGGYKTSVTLRRK